VALKVNLRKSENGFTIIAEAMSNYYRVIIFDILRSIHSIGGSSSIKYLQLMESDVNLRCEEMFKEYGNILLFIVRDDILGH
jgi:hypothetical protein